MRYIYLLLILLVAISCTPSSTDKPEEPWVALLNGNSLENWEKLNGTAPYEVEGNVIIGTTVNKSPNTFLATKENYDDFIFEFEVLVDSTMNSGVQFRSNSLPDFKNGRVHGYQCEIDPSDRAWSGGIYDEGRRGWLYNLDGYEEGQKAFKNGIWNQYRIEAVGDTLRVWVNGINTSNLVDTVTGSGFIALQVHGIPDTANPGKEVKWRNLRIITESPERYKRQDVSAPLKVNEPGQWPITTQ